jgi:dihydrofolate reductase
VRGPRPAIPKAIMSSAQPLAIVVAVGRNRAIGQKGRLPWTMPGDLAHFRALTMGTPMIMGRRTFDSIGRALPGRESIVVTRDNALALPAGVHRVADPHEAMMLAKARAEAMKAASISLIGGATLFAAMMPMVERLHVTIVDLAPEADTVFPVIDPAIWRETSRISPPRDPNDEAACVFVDYTRR